MDFFFIIFDSFFKGSLEMIWQRMSDVMDESVSCFMFYPNPQILPTLEPWRRSQVLEGNRFSIGKALWSRKWVITVRIQAYLNPSVFLIITQVLTFRGKDTETGSLESPGADMGSDTDASRLFCTVVPERSSSSSLSDVLFH